VHRQVYLHPYPKALMLRNHVSDGEQGQWRMPIQFLSKAGTA
jgi:hypothetical protein